MRPSIRQRLHQALHAAWRGLRQLSNDDAYERYRAHALRYHPNHSYLSRQDFYDQELRRKWSGVNRCC